MAEHDERCRAVESRLAYQFRDTGLLVRALTHSSGKGAGLPSNERLEFLGDSILGAVIARHLFDRFPDWNEGELTRVKSAVVSADSLAAALTEADIVPAIVVGKGMSGRGYPTSLLANVFEALVAALYLDGGLPAAEAFILGRLAPRIDGVAKEEVAKNWKSLLQQYVQKTFSATPTYRIVSESGPEHVKRFEVVALIGPGREVGRGEGRSKKEAEQRAAEATLRAFIGEQADAAREQDLWRESRPGEDSGAHPLPPIPTPPAAPAGEDASPVVEWPAES